MLEKIIIAGSGGQGIMLLGKVIAQAAMQEDKFVTWIPSYGAEVRGGAAYCMVVISDTQIGSPYVDKADTLIVMNQQSLDKFKDRLKNKGLLIINSSIAFSRAKSNPCLLKYPFTDIAEKLGNVKVANMVVLGCYLSKKKVVSAQAVLEAMLTIAPADKKNLIEINKQALFAGTKLQQRN